VNPDLPHLQSVLNAADVLIQVLDARDPLPYLSTSLDEKAMSQGKKVIYVLTKIGKSAVTSFL
jgi:nuclear GTP-binding protein